MNAYDPNGVHARKSLHWTRVGAIAGVAAVAIALIAALIAYAQWKTPTSTMQLNSGGNSLAAIVSPAPDSQPSNGEMAARATRPPNAPGAYAQFDMTLKSADIDARNSAVETALDDSNPAHRQVFLRKIFATGDPDLQTMAIKSILKTVASDRAVLTIKAPANDLSNSLLSSLELIEVHVNYYEPSTSSIQGEFLRSGSVLGGTLTGSVGSVGVTFSGSAELSQGAALRTLKLQVKADTQGRLVGTAYADGFPDANIVIPLI